MHQVISLASLTVKLCIRSSHWHPCDLVILLSCHLVILSSHLHPCELVIMWSCGFISTVDLCIRSSHLHPCHLVIMSSPLSSHLWSCDLVILSSHWHPCELVILWCCDLFVMREDEDEVILYQAHLTCDLVILSSHLSSCHLSCALVILWSCDLFVMKEDEDELTLYPGHLVMMWIVCVIDARRAPVCTALGTRPQWRKKITLLWQVRGISRHKKWRKVLRKDQMMTFRHHSFFLLWSRSGCTEWKARA
jgi:hypothetical protein